MLLNDLKRVTELDNKINDLHQELASLYRLRVKYFGQSQNAHYLPSPQASDEAKATSKQLSWAEQEHQRLVAVWQKYGINIPSFSNMKDVLEKTEGAIISLVNAQPELENKLTTVIVPPAKFVNPPKHNTLRKRQEFITSADHFSSNLTSTSKSRKWRVLVIYSLPEAINFGSAAEIIKNQLHIIGGYDTSALGVSEYIAFSLQQDVPIDEGTWTLLLADRTKDGLVPSVTFLDGQYRFEIDETKGWFGDERFRPAVEVGSVKPPKTE